jgi:hypothetical protein
VLQAPPHRPPTAPAELRGRRRGGVQRRYAGPHDHVALRCAPRPAHSFCAAVQLSRVCGRLQVGGRRQDAGGAVRGRSDKAREEAGPDRLGSGSALQVGAAAAATATAAEQVAAAISSWAAVAGRAGDTRSVRRCPQRCRPRHRIEKSVSRTRLRRYSSGSEAQSRCDGPAHRRRAGFTGRRCPAEGPAPPARRASECFPAAGSRSLLSCACPRFVREAHVAFDAFV